MTQSGRKALAVLWMSFACVWLCSYTISHTPMLSQSMKRMNIFAGVWKSPTSAKLFRPAKVPLWAVDTTIQLIQWESAQKMQTPGTRPGGLALFADATATKKKIRVAYFGDSMIEGDLITQDIRSVLQNKFGGAGVGFVPIHSPVAAMRATIKSKAEGDWVHASIVDGKTPMNELAISGYVHRLYADSVDKHKTGMVSFQGSSSFKSLATFDKIVLFYCLKEGQATVVAGIGGKKTTHNLIADGSVNVLEWRAGGAAVATFTFESEGLLDVHGFSFESDEGIYVDNYAVRSNSGLGLASLSPGIAAVYQNHMNYDLIVLQYGTNVVSAKHTDYNWYTSGMIRVINYLKAAFPSAAILVVSVADKSIKNEEGYDTDPAIPLVVQSQSDAAARTGSAFYNFFDAMGGQGSMVTWVKKDLAAKDYTHLSFYGGRLMAYHLAQYLMVGGNMDKMNPLITLPDDKQ